MKTQDAVQCVIAAFNSANLVALGERHWAREDSEFRLKLIRDPPFAQTVTDIVIEFANPLYQDLLDRYVNGGVAPSTDLRKIWQDTTQPGAWDSPVYQAFLHAAREINAGCLYFGKTPPDFVQPPPALYNGTPYGRKVQRRRAILFGLH
jgi:uncharacterized iron-regulated protein